VHTDIPGVAHRAEGKEREGKEKKKKKKRKKKMCCHKDGIAFRAVPRATTGGEQGKGKKKRRKKKKKKKKKKKRTAPLVLRLFFETWFSRGGVGAPRLRRLRKEKTEEGERKTVDVPRIMS